MEIVKGKITEISEDGTVIIRASLPSFDRAATRDYSIVEIGFPDGRTISPEQRRMIYAMLNYIADWQGDLPENVKKLMKMEFVVNRLQALAKNIFSLSDCDVTTAKEFCNFLIEFIVENRIPCDTPLYELAAKNNDITRYVYKCLLEKVCACCGKKAELHHVDAVGMGADRTKVSHIGREALPLCRKHHTEYHTIGGTEFLKRYHLEPVKIDKAIARANKLRG